MGEGEVVKDEEKGGACDIERARIVGMSKDITRTNGHAQDLARIDDGCGSEGLGNHQVERTDGKEAIVGEVEESGTSVDPESTGCPALDCELGADHG